MTRVQNRTHWLDQRALRKTLSWPVVARSLRFAVVMGTVLNSINQGDAIVSGGPVNHVKLALTYVVPFFSASYGAYSAFSRLDSVSEPRAPAG